MFVIVTYDVGEKRVNKIRKKLKEYLYWSQNSVFEGEISDAKLRKCMYEIKKIIDEDYDSVYVYKIANPNNVNKQVYGKENSLESIFL